MKMVIRRRRRRRYRRELRAGLIIILFALLIVLGISLFRKKPLPVVTINISSAEMREEEEVPTFTATAICDQKGKKTKLGKRPRYTLEDFVNDINNGVGYIIEPEGDCSVEGKYKVTVRLDDELQAQYDEQWNNKFELVIEKGELLVRNKYGDWDNDMFVLLDGSYAKGWYEIGADTYYFGEDNARYTGEQKVDGKVYYFDENGKFNNEKNLYNPIKPVVALTFDDGPGAYTMDLLEFLEENDAKATFFMLGSRVKDRPEAVQKMLEIGCELGNHTTTHPQLTKCNGAEIDQEIEGTNQYINSAAGQEATLLRPPYGSHNGQVRELAGMPIILWSLDTLDWEYRDVEKIKEEMRKTIKDGDIVLMHDIYDTTVQAVKEMIVELKEEGYQFLTVSEQAQARGIELKDGAVYNNFYKK